MSGTLTSQPEIISDAELVQLFKIQLQVKYMPNLGFHHINDKKPPQSFDIKPSIKKIEISKIY
jgi:hypothetical protein